MYIPFFGAMRPARSRCLGGTAVKQVAPAVQPGVKWASDPAVTIGKA